MSDARGSDDEGRSVAEERPAADERSASSSWSAWVDARLGAIRDAGLWRSPAVFDARGTEGVLSASGLPVVSFASNDYLGLSGHPAVVDAARDALSRFGAGSGASRLITGTRPVHDELERALAEWKSADAAVCFPTGYSANVGTLSGLGVGGTRIFSDELNHASIVDGCRLANAPVSIYRHADVGHLDELMAASGESAIVVTDTVFSMDGDVAPLVEIADVCRRRGALLVLDEAHAVLGPEIGPEVIDDLVVLRVGTLSKTLGALGGFVAGPRPFVELLVNVARSYIFTTALSPADAAAALCAVGIVRGVEGETLRARLRSHVDVIAPGHPSPIIPIIIGDTGAAIQASAALRERGLWVPAIRPPTVPRGTSRLRVTLSAAHTEEQVAWCRCELADVCGDSVFVGDVAQAERSSPRGVH